MYNYSLDRQLRLNSFKAIYLLFGPGLFRWYAVNAPTLLPGVSIEGTNPPLACVWARSECQEAFSLAGSSHETGSLEAGAINCSFADHCRALHPGRRQSPGSTARSCTSDRLNADFQTRPDFAVVPIRPDGRHSDEREIRPGQELKSRPRG
jgi:hypothetical protein